MSRMYLLNIILLIAALFTLSCEKEVFTGEPEEPPPQNAMIFIDSKPQNALIYINDKNTGFRTPATFNWLSEDYYKITLKLDLFKDTTFYVQSVLNELKSYFIDYYLNPGHYGKLYCSSFPQQADIYLNDSSIGKVTPAILTGLFPGVYKVKYAKQLHRADSGEVLVRGSVMTYFHLSLEDTSVWVSYRKNNSKISSNNLSSVIVDENNIKWIGTKDYGLCSFDGKNWKIFNNINSPLIYNNINAIAVDRNNILWIATPGSLQSFDGNTWIDYSSYLPSTYVTSIAFDNLGNTWIGTQNGLVKYDGISWTVFNTKNSNIPGDFVTAVAVDYQNRIWIGTNVLGIGVFDGKRWKNYNMSNMNLSKNVGNSISKINCDRRGNVYVAHSQNLMQGRLGGITKFNGNEWEVLTLNVVPSEQIESIYIDKNDMIWVGTKNGLTKFYDDPANAVFYTTINSKIPGKDIVGVAVDKNDDLWVATFGGGLGKLKKGNF